MVKTRRQERMSFLLRNIISSFIKSKIASKSIITVTLVEVSDDLRTAKIFISVFPEDKEKEILALLKNKNRDIHNFIKAKIKMKFLPLVSFEIDRGIKIERKIEEILNMAA